MSARARTAGLAAALAVVFATVVAWAYLSVERPMREERSLRESAERVLPFAPADVREVRLSSGGAEVILARREGGWTVTAASSGPADPEAVEACLERLAALRRRAVVPPGDGGLAGFGLDPPRARLSVSLDGGRRLSLDIGGDNPFDHTLFALAGGEVVVLPAGARAALALDPSRLALPPSPDGGNRG